MERIPASDTSWIAALQGLLDSARGLVDRLGREPLFQRLLQAFVSLPEADRETILGVLERDAAWVRIIAHTAGPTGITVRPNPHASLYLHILDEPAPSPRDVEVIRMGIARFLPLLPLFFEEGVHEQWTRSARELIRHAPPELRDLGRRLAHEVLALIAEPEGTPAA